MKMHLVKCDKCSRCHRTKRGYQRAHPKKFKWNNGKIRKVN